MNILEATSDPKVFAPAFCNPDTWQSWFAFLAVLFGLPLSPEQLEVYRVCTGRLEPPLSPFTEAWLVCGRRAGKSFILALAATFLAFFLDWRPYLGPGEGGTIMIIAADRKQARVIMRYIRGILGSVPMLARTIVAERAEGIDLVSRVTIEVHTASFRTVRGYTIVAALLDEIAFWPTDEHASDPDHEIINAIKPALATVPGSIMLCASSPYARKGALWDAYQRHFGKNSPVLVWQAPTRTMNPTVAQSVIDEALAEDPSRAAAEYLAEFRTDVEAFVSREAVEACLAWDLLERQPVYGVRYAAFVDPSGGSADSMTLAVAHKDGDAAVLDLIREVRPPFSPEGVVSEFADVLKSYGITAVKGDRYAGEWPREQFRKHGIRYEPSEDPKSTIYQNLLPMLNSGRVELVGSRRLLAQLVGLERRVSRAGRDSIDHAPGGHDDVANAVAGALLGTVNQGFTRIGAIDFARTGRIFWHDEKPERQRIRIVHVSEQEAIKQKAEGTW